MAIYRKLKVKWPDIQNAFAQQYFYQSGGNVEHLVTLLKDTNTPLSNETRCFIAQVLSGEIKVPTKEKKNYLRDLNIYWLIQERIYNGQKLTSSGSFNGEGAASLVAKMHDGITEENAVKIYTRMKKLMEPKQHDPNFYL